MDSSGPSYDSAQLLEAERLLHQSVDTLFEDLARQTGERGFPENLLRAGRARYRAIAQQTKVAICSDDTIRVLCTDKEVDRGGHIVCAVADAILHTMGVPVPAMTVAAILVQSGLESYCGAIWR